MSKNFLAFLTTSSEEDSDLFRFFGVDESADPGLEAGGFLLPSGFTAARFLDFFLSYFALSFSIQDHKYTWSGNIQAGRWH